MNLIYYEFNLGAKICISSELFKSGVDRGSSIALEMLIPNTDEMTSSRKMRVTERFSR